MVKRITLTVINDNTPARGLLSDWGWSLLAESEAWRALFDAGPGPEIIEENFKRLGLRLDGLSFAFLSHPHHDHCGGLSAVARANPGIKVYAPAGAAHCVPEGLKAVEVAEPAELALDFWSTGTFRSSPVDEQSAVVKVGGSNALLVGCSHPGIGKIADVASARFGDISFVIGGFHQPSEEQLQKAFSVAKFLAPAHCSGDEAKRKTHELGERYVEVRTGTRIVLEAGSKPTVVWPRGVHPAIFFGGLTTRRQFPAG
ncbi:MAG: MBL fold metallo-hydrolase [Thermoprotei archaeon]